MPATPSGSSGKNLVTTASTARNTPMAPRMYPVRSPGRRPERAIILASGNEAIDAPTDRHAADRPASVLLPVRSSASDAVTE